MALIAISGRLPPLVKQLQSGSPTEGSDCGFASIVTTILYSSQGKVGPKSKSEWASWIKLVRDLADRPEGDCRFRQHAMPVFKHPELKERFREAKLKRMPVAQLSGATFAVMKEHLRRNRAILLAVNYGEHRAAGGLMGSSSFSDGHALVLVGAPEPDDRGVLEVNEGDPLFDGRDTFPSGWQRVELFPFRRSAGEFGKNPWGVGKVEAIAVGRAKKLSAPASGGGDGSNVGGSTGINPDDDPATMSLVEARAAVTALRRQNEELRAALEGLADDAKALARRARAAAPDENDA